MTERDRINEEFVITVQALLGIPDIALALRSIRMALNQLETDLRALPR